MIIEYSLVIFRLLYLLVVKVDMKLRTEIEIEKHNFRINHFDTILTIGSCFAENIAEYFRTYRFNILGNPFGVLYNPISIYNSLKLTTEKKIFTESDLINNQGEWHSFYHHSDFSSDNISLVLKKINDGIIQTNEFLKSAELIIITFGTSYVYRHLPNNIIVSNCHKIPQKEFEHFRLSIHETEESILKTIEIIEKLNRKAKIILTVSPVRHWKDGAHNNQLSKSNLLLAINNIVNSKNNCSYFPAYEILMDDLRDYRFYKEDLIHPNKIATDYIWDKFSKSFFTDECKQTIQEVSKTVAGRNHRVRNPFSSENQKFVISMIKHIEALQVKYKHLVLDDDLQYFNSKLI